MVDTPLFPEWDEQSFKDANAAKHEAMERVAKNADVAWLSAAKHAGVFVARNRMEFTTDPIWKVLEHQGVNGPHEPRAMGPVMQALIRAGVCRNTGRVKPSVRAECHGRPLAVYESLVYKGAHG